MSEVTGTVRGTRSGFAFLIREDGGEDLLISAGALGGAIHGDRVRASLTRRGQDFRPEVRVEEILARTNPVFTGNVFHLGKSWFVRPDSPLLPERVRLRLGKTPGISGQKILFQVENRPDREKTLLATALETIGDEADARLDLVVIATEFGLPLRFSEQALLEGEENSRAADPEQDRRQDYRDQFVLTIDPEDAKDFDDAVSIRRLDGGGYALSVHIADVTSYVPEGSALDQEGAARGTSVYFPGSVLPMLPDAISTQGATLAPDTDKRTLSVDLRFSAEGEQRQARVSRGLIRSRARLEYRQAQAILEGSEPAPAELGESLRCMRELARLLRRRRFGHGGFDLEVPETEMVLGADGVPLRIFRHESLESHHLIEEFMIAANRAVGDWAQERNLQFLYRIHQEPDVLALTRFEETVLTLLPGTAPAELSSLPRLRRWIQNLPPGPKSRLIHRLFLRSLKKAVYSPVDLGHFGLGIRGYSHFTSPIRRYPDLFNHRRIKELLDGRGPTILWEETRRTALHSSQAEINAEEAEREMARLKTTRYMERRLGDIASGHISGLSPQGLFVELDEVPIEGIVPREALPAGARLDMERFCWFEARSRREYRPGDAVRVQVARCDLRARRIEFLLLRERAGAPKRSKGAPKAKRKGRKAPRPVRPSSRGRPPKRSRGPRRGRSR